MKYEQAKKLSYYISKDYSEGIFRLLALYQNLAASEAASRLNLHIKTVQDFLESMAELNILLKEEVYEGKRPYYRYTLNTRKIVMEIDIDSFLTNTEDFEGRVLKIRERKNSKVRFNIGRDNKSISSVVIWIGKGRSQKERKINLTKPQGQFLYNLPFPMANFLSVADIMLKAGIEKRFKREIEDVVDVLIELGVIEMDS